MVVDGGGLQDVGVELGVELFFYERLGAEGGGEREEEKEGLHVVKVAEGEGRGKRKQEQAMARAERRGRGGCAEDAEGIGAMNYQLLAVSC